MEKGSLKCSANYIPLTPISFLERSAIVYADRVSVVHGDLKFTWKQTHDRCVRLASALTQLGISRGDVVAVLAPNIPEMYELHFAVPMAGAVLCTFNIRHDSSMVSVLLKHSEAKVIFVDYQFLDAAKGAFKILSEKGVKLPNLVMIPECHSFSGAHGRMSRPEGLEYESFLARGKADFAIVRPNDEWDPIALNYTSGTTSSPKGVVYSHRGAYLNSLSAVLLNEMLSMPVYLWTVPMFHCNGWCLTWAVAAQGGTNVCLRNVTAKGIFDSIARHRVTHMGGAPTVLNMIINAPASEQRPLPGIVSVMTGAAPPPPQVLFKMEELGFNVTHSYGLTETYGPGTVCAWKPEWNSLPLDARAKIKSRQGVQHIGMEEIDVKDPATMQSVPPDAKTIGEVMFRGNTVMNGYLKDIKATQEAFRGGWFRSGDLGVKHPDGYIELKDRSKDIIISGGENISTIEVESVIFSHPAVLEAAVVGRPDNHWGETPCAFVKLKDGFSATAEDIIKYCRDRLPHYMAPRTIVFEDLPRLQPEKRRSLFSGRKPKLWGAFLRQANCSFHKYETSSLELLIWLHRISR
ncbi:putative acyl-activating enzyme 1, peroxisomal [Sesamum alatum]|uniref:Acyl-activating enzyme 1, peroxisomal n=1 Tax=Sesamum alatum TaxID=300844 RepID=A0AAE1YPR6_9LAMI|nr:putative acyl-activating enzyme 1, peroxisomal [Sesamum alatum]